MSPDADTPRTRVGTTLRDKWRLERLLGRGGMASVYLARHEIGRHDAIKILHEHYADNSGIRARFEREARAVNHFRHPGAVEIRDIDVADDGCPFLVMEYLEGEPLQAHLGRLASDTGELLRIVIDVLDVLGAAHRERIIHRDIKPANVFLLADGRVKVLDFGIARMREAAGEGKLTQEGMMLGTGGYMPPEQIVGEEVDHRADLFAVGALMYRAVAQRPVHHSAITQEMLVRMATEPAPPLARAAPGAPPDLCLVVDRALAFDPKDRYPDARTMQEDVRALRDGGVPAYARAVLAGDAEAAEVARKAAQAASQSGGSTPKKRVDAATRMTGRVIHGRFRLERLIGKGGMGAVYEAVDQGSGARVAVKLVLSHLASEDSSAPGRFRREARATAAIDSPHAVRVLDADLDEQGIPFLVMELLEGRDLERWLEQIRPLGAAAAARIFVDACRGLAAAHAQGIVHRDIKPANLFLSRAPDGAITVKVLDFGLAKERGGLAGQSSQGSLTETGGVVGTPRYASPEQVKNAKLVDKRSDVWSLCMTIYEALSGVVPWSDCEAVGEIIIAIATTDVAPLCQVAPWVDPALGAIVDRGLARDPAERWQSADDLLAALAPIAGDGVLHEAMLAGRSDSGASRVTATPPSSPVPASLRSVPGLAASDFDHQAPRRGRSLLWIAAAAALAVGALGALALRDRGAPAAAAHDAPIAASIATPSAPAVAQVEPKAAPPPPPSTANAAPSASAVPVATPRVAPAGPRPAASAPPKPAPAPPPSAPKLELKREW
jgi:serine/threonine protein kinase